MLSTSRTLPYVCARCARQSAGRVRTYSSTSASPSLPAEYLPRGTALLPNRQLIYIAGRDAPVFLHNLLTNNVTASGSRATYTAFLNPTGRILYDAVLYPVAWSQSFRDWRDGQVAAGALKGGTQLDWAAFIEVDASVVPQVLQHIKRYKLRSKFEYRAVDPGEWEVWSSWDAAHVGGPEAATPRTPPGIEASAVANEGGGAPSTSSASFPTSTDPSPTSPILLHEPRPTLLSRLLHRPSSTNAAPSALPEPPPATLAHYTLHRHLHALPEGAAEMAPGAALPHEHNLDLLGAVDFRKGCYVGQELTIRTQHTGVVRKRIVPCALYEASPAPTALAYAPPSTEGAGVPTPPRGTDIKPVEGRGRSAGKWVAGVGNVGLGLCRLEMMTDVRVTAEGEGAAAAGWKDGKEFGMSWECEGGMAGVKVKAFVPGWMRPRLTPRKTQRRVE